MNISLWVRAVAYSLIIGVAWLAVIPELITLATTPSAVPHLRSARWIAIGTALLIAGVCIATWAASALVRHGKGTPFPLDPTKRLVRSGPYRYVRNPQAIAMTWLVLGVIAILDNAWMWLLVPMIAVYLEGMAYPWEKRQLTRQFGAEFEAYASEVPRWLPSVRRER